MILLMLGTRFVRRCAVVRGGMMGLAFCSAFQALQVHAEIPTFREAIPVPDPVELVPRGGVSLAGSQTLIPPAPTTDVPAAGSVLVPPSPQPPTSQPARRPPATVAIPASPVPDEWVIAITPLEKQFQNPLADRYRAVYESIPFRRAEYLANPSYRHDTTVEILFGQMRQTVINRNDSPQRVVNPRPQLTQPYPLSKGELYSYWPLLQYSYPLPLLSPVE